MILAQETTCWLGSIDWRVLMVALQLLGLGYLVLAKLRPGVFPLPW